MRADYDSPWKEVLERYFPAFLAWFFPVAHAAIAWEQGHHFLDKELQKVVRDAKLGRRWADKLVQVTTHDGGKDWLLVHIEVQGQREIDFAQRMFSYNYRLFDRYARPVISLAVLGEGQGETIGRFGYGRWGSETCFSFPVVCLNDYRDRQTEMLLSTNPFAVIVHAHLQAQATAHDPDCRYQAKLQLVKSLYKRGWVRQDILELFRVIDWLLQLPTALEDQLWVEMQDHEEATHMRYVTSVERIGIRKGLQQGLESERRMLLRQIRRRFGEALVAQSAPVLEQIQQPVAFEELGEALFDCADEQAWLIRINAVARETSVVSSEQQAGSMKSDH